MNESSPHGIPTRVFNALGLFEDGWCEPTSSFELQPSEDIAICQMELWVKPEPQRVSAHLLVRVGSREPFRCALPYDVPVSVQVACDCRGGESIPVTRFCDNSVSEKGGDRRALSYRQNATRFFVMQRGASALWVSAPTPASSGGSDAPDSQGLAIDGLWGRELRGRIWNSSSAGSASLAVYDGEQQIGAVKVKSSTPRPGAANRPRGQRVERNFGYALPLELYDGETHTLWIEFAGRRECLVFIGDPTLLLPRHLRERTHLDAVIEQSSAAIMRGVRAQAQLLEAQTRAIEAQTQAIRALGAGQATPDGASLSVTLAPRSPAERYGPRFPEALLAVPGGKDFIWLGVIDWNYRLQRPQHLATHLAVLGNRVLYVAIQFDALDDRGRFGIVASPHPGVFEIRLRVGGKIPANIYAGFDGAQIAEIRKALDEVVLALNVTAPAVVVEYPSWYPVATAIPGALVIHDCLDFAGGFNNVPEEVLQLEESLIANADIVVTASRPLADMIGKRRPCTIIRNGADVGFFAKAARTMAAHGAEKRPVVGYFGAIAEWFQIDWIESCAKARPGWDFVLVGSQTGCDIQKAAELPNVRFLGERPYAELPSHLAEFDVALIPFKLSKLIECTNPVKLYEYMAAGKPVVASAMPEVVNGTDMAYVAKDAASFERQIARALEEDSPKLQRLRQAWARAHTWDERASRFLETVDATTSLVSVVILTYGGWEFTRECLHSLFTLSDYPSLEVIVVDNASTDQTREELERMQRRNPSMRVILNDTNLGFSAGNNVGLRAAAGEYVILLNNDTYVTRGWIRDLIRPLQLNPKLGLAGPLTNNIGNEQKVAITYANMEEMVSSSRAFTRERLRRRLQVENLAFFCVAVRRDVLERVGLLDEVYGLGFFEDDDYCKRVLEAGYEIVIVDDVFVHHRLSASFDKLKDDQKQKQMEKSKAIYSERWGPWKPHAYRDSPGFG